MKRTSTLLLLLAVVLTVSAQAISQQEAMERAIKFLQSAPAENGARQAMKQRPQLTPVAVGADRVYAFNVAGGGFVIASGDERALPVLGYSTSSQLSAADMPEALRAWLNTYSEAISALGNTAIAAPARESDRRPAVEPLLKTIWAQEAPYNDECPIYNGKVKGYIGQRYVTGCVATAMAQVMNYHQWPQEPTAVIPAYTDEVSNMADGVTESFTFDALPATTFDWGNMRNAYLGPADPILGERQLLADVTAAQRKAVATLMRYCGQAVQMSYSTTTSLSDDAHVAIALRNYFNYDKGARLVSRFNYTIDEWETMIYTEVAEGRPVVYGGTSDRGGHCFVCDGYDGQGKFHINWGWQGLSDTYFSLSVLEPNQSGERALEDGSGFNYNQDAVVGIRKPTAGTTAATEEPLFLPYCNYWSEQNVMNAQITYNDFRYPALTAQVQLFTLNADGTYTAVDNRPLEQEFKSGLYYNVNFSAMPFDLGADRTERLYIRVRRKKADGTYADWQLIGRPDMYFEKTVKSGTVTVRTMPAAQFEIVKAEVTGGTGAVGTANDITMYIKNLGAAEYQGKLLIRPYCTEDLSGEAAYNAVLNDPMLYDRLTVDLPEGAYLKAGETTPITFSLKPWKAGNYLLLLFEATDTRGVIGYTNIAFPATPVGITKIVNSKSVNSKSFDLLGRSIATPKRHQFYIKDGKKYIK